jgi:hypothetical protein
MRTTRKHIAPLLAAVAGVTAIGTAPLAAADTSAATDSRPRPASPARNWEPPNTSACHRATLSSTTRHRSPISFLKGRLESYISGLEACAQNRFGILRGVHGGGHLRGHRRRVGGTGDGTGKQHRVAANSIASAAALGQCSARCTTRSTGWRCVGITVHCMANRSP